MKNLYKYLILVFSISITTISQADSITEQRRNYQNIKAACTKNNIHIIDKLLPKLKDYPLYPYIQSDILMQKINNDVNSLSTKISVIKFIKKYHDIPVVNSISNQFINSLAQQKKWKTLIDFSPKPPSQIKALCNWHYAKAIVKNEPINFNILVKILLNRIHVPKDCNKLFFVSDKYIKISYLNTIELICVAMKAHDEKLVRYLTNILPEDYKNTGNWIIKFQEKPISILDFIKKAKLSPFTLQAIKYSLFHLSHKDIELARRSITTILNHYNNISASDIQELKDIVASNMIRENISYEQKKWRDEVIIHSKSISLIERRIRLSLMYNEMNKLKQLLIHLPHNAKQKEEWQYWLSSIYYLKGNKKIGDIILRNLMKKRGFYSLVAAQKLGLNYKFKHNISPAPDYSISKLKEIRRIRELIYWKYYNLANIEWTNLIANKSIRQKKMLARYANEQQWWYLSVKTITNAKIWDNIKERFPLAWNSIYKKYTNNKTITKNYAMAVARQESAWDPQAHSLMHAMGLMQLEPTAVKQTINVYNIKKFLGLKKLFDPEINIWIGTGYLEYVFKHLGKNRVLTSAAYNAGISKTKKWRKKSAGKLHVIAFIEAIPFRETREYVKNVLLYNAYYNYITGKPKHILTSSEWKYHY
ncbi:murein transglycosylase [Pantoea sp. SoEX]|uniref:murein transglycosylase n=1 Tax=Pantoea sp. SoEX TaxID=2576763 RepID=UPI001358C49D|nr:murein transglycosylase [Pantoea sp. SoEX]MXP51116.1 murein transglycosylase [Pantoea sp. SoEX]